LNASRTLQASKDVRSLPSSRIPRDLQEISI
jgi:hypothetical protein